MKLKRISLIAASTLGILLMQGCAVTPSENLKRAYVPTYYSVSVTDYPIVGEIKTVEVGESLISKDKQTTIPSVDIEQTMEHEAENLGKKFKLSLLPGRYVEKGKDSLGKFYEGKLGSLTENGKVLKIAAGIYVLDSDPVKTEIYVGTDDLRPLTYLANGIPFIKSIQHRRDELSFRKELVYTGVAQNVVSILYREFKDDTARPAFSQDLKYDLAESKVVGYRGARFEIIKATNQGLIYKTLKQLD